MNIEGFDLDAFIESVNADKPRGGNHEDYLNKVLMNTKDNQGTLTWIPIMSRTLKSFYLKLDGVREFEAKTTILDKGHGWYRILPLSFYGNLSEEDLDLYNEVIGYYDTLKDNDSCERDELRYRRYTLLFGVCSSMVNTDGNAVEGYDNCACIFVYPSLDPISALGTAINTKITAMKGKKEWIPYVMSPSRTGREGVVMVTYTKSTGVGYDCSVSFETNSALNQVIDPAYEIPEKYIEFFDDVLPQFLGWIYDRENKSLFNRVAFKELRDQLKIRLKEEGLIDDKSNSEGQLPADATKTYENKNNLNDNSGARKLPF